MTISNSKTSPSKTIFLGATDTVTITLTWALTLLLNNPRALKKVQDELDTHVGRERQVQDCDMDKLVFLQAVVKETLRLHPPVPLNVPHVAIEDCVVGGYHVPKDTSVFINLRKIHRNSTFWSDPQKFLPERFLTDYKDLELKGNQFELLPFGSGRRSCPAMSFAIQVVQSILANLIHGFELRIALGDKIDTTESIGLTNHKATPIEVLVSPSLPCNISV